MSAALVFFLRQVKQELSNLQHAFALLKISTVDNFHETGIYSPTQEREIECQEETLNALTYPSTHMHEEERDEEAEPLVTYNKEYVDRNGCPAFEVKEDRIVQEKGEGEVGLDKRIQEAEFEEQLLINQEELRIKLADVR